MCNLNTTIFGKKNNYTKPRKIVARDTELMSSINVDELIFVLFNILIVLFFITRNY